jgi:CheY-like chemotaxis protein
MSENKKIMLVDDDITSLDIIALLFERKGFDVERSASGFQILEQVANSGADIAIVDLMMPEMDGVETVTRLREKGFNKPVIAFTASNDPTLHGKAIDAGCTSVVTKPCKPSKLVEMVTNFIDNN